MFKTFYLLLSLIILFNFVSCGKQSRNENEESNLELTSDAIVNGKAMTTKNSLAHQVVAIEIQSENGRAICTGSIISSSYILTAAHCVENHPKNIKIIFSNNLKKDSAHFLSVDKFFQHPNWNQHLNSGEGDLAILHFKGELPKNYTPVELAQENFEISSEAPITVAGFGVTNGVRHLGAGVLRYAKTEFLNRKNATEVIIDGSDSSVCFGDSGGPAYILKNKKYIQWGVASSVSTESCDEVAIQTDVVPYLNWINKIIKKKNT